MMNGLLIPPVIIIGGLFFLGLKSQKGEAPGLMNGQLAEPSGRPNCVSSETNVQPEYRVRPLDGTREQMLAAIDATGGTLTSERADYISATYMSGVFKFVDDVELRAGPGGLWHVRSGSRVGHSDMGANRKRVGRLRDALASL